jgi:hypothetical protein
MTIKEQLVKRIQGMPEEEAQQWLQRLESESSREPSALEVLWAFGDEIAKNAPEEDLLKMPVDLAMNPDRYHRSELSEK